MAGKTVPAVITRLFRLLKPQFPQSKPLMCFRHSQFGGWLITMKWLRDWSSLEWKIVPRVICLQTKKTIICTKMYVVCVTTFCSSLVFFFNWFHYHFVAALSPSVSVSLLMLYSTNMQLIGNKARSSIMAACKYIQD